MLRTTSIVRRLPIHDNNDYIQLRAYNSVSSYLLMIIY